MGRPARKEETENRPDARPWPMNPHAYRILVPSAPFGVGGTGLGKGATNHAARRGRRYAPISTGAAPGARAGRLEGVAGDIMLAARGLFEDARGRLRATTVRTSRRQAGVTRQW